ncbi:hypothetical protein [Gordonia sp. (in: high G+C Gram-positive bacteria)]|uniref:hypothetical protein n=1 Tax=Gordonia sp. (in: high G+C Gram-positive bacteria) TaxID=84139 RepID=UPI003C742A21
MATTDDFGPDDRGPDDFDRFAREAGDGLRRLLRQALENPRATAAWADIAATAVRPRSAAESGHSSQVRPEPKTETQPVSSGAGNGVWAVVVSDGSPSSGARVERIFANELDALRANQTNTNPGRRVRFIEFDTAID